MRIALTLLSGVGYGGATYFRNLVPALAAIDRTNEYHLFVPTGHALRDDIHAPNIMFHEVVGPATSTVERFRYEQLTFPEELRRHRIDLLYTAKNLAVFRAPCPQVIAIRNMEPFRYQEFENAWMLDVRSRIKWELTKRSITRADAIVAVSNAVRDVAVDRFPEAAGKVRVVYNGTPIISFVSLRATEGSEAIPDHERRDCRVGPMAIGPPRNDAEAPFFLTASKFVAYANQLALVEGYAQLVAARPDVPPLWFAGGVHDQRYFDRVRTRVTTLGLDHRVRFLGLIPQDELHLLMRSATAFVFPSMLESCPHTLLEAMACGVPIAASNVPPMPEICDSAAMYFTPRDPGDIARVMARLLDDAALRGRLVAVGTERVRAFTWERTAHGLVEALNHVLAPRVTTSVR